MAKHPLPVITNTNRVVASGTTSAGSTWSNVWHIRRVGAAPLDSEIASMIAEVAKIYSTSYGTGKRAFLNNSPTGVKLSNIAYTPLDGISATRNYAQTAAGLLVENSLPAEVTVAVTLRTDRRGRRYRGRVYLPPQGVSVQASDGNPNSTYTPQWAAQVDSFIAAIEPMGWELVVASYGTPMPDGTRKWAAFATRVRYATCDPYWDTQRRRGRP